MLETITDKDFDNLIGSKVDKDIADFLQEKYNILDTLNSTYFDEDMFTMLPATLKKSRKDVFDPDDRYILVLFDCYYYLESENLFLHNFVKMWKYLDIPAYTLLVLTNNFGITDEFMNYFQDNPDNDKPTVIETFYNPISYRNQKTPMMPDNFEDIDYHCLHLAAGTPRPHRHILHDFLQKQHMDKTVLSIEGIV